MVAERDRRDDYRMRPQGWFPAGDVAGQILDKAREVFVWNDPDGHGVLLVI